jgi:Monomethylamine methyltransferase MtmB
MVDHHTGLEAGFQGEVSVAATRCGITREKANEIALELLPLYKDTFKATMFGKPFNELYDLKTITRKQEWQDCYRQAKEILSKLSLSFTQGPYD